MIKIKKIIKIIIILILNLNLKSLKKRRINFLILK